MILLTYKFAFNRFIEDGETLSVFNLLVEEKYLFGLFSSQHLIQVDINMFQSIPDTTTHWDWLINNKVEFKRNQI
ncbi:hypothetical protein DBR40_09065 [Pedobacter sp. KBW01]|uniref:hypothetical protein n=1 Tax=Pedobacter sp. KBW01 TaxID=2153364 RepID=UPI000F59069E|nr:hypothetical protein [Pedobacter sp. KBW01]RQO78089.1 hypothetical protein DBR40_09065 [Pedobacter sp. KBW01]